MNEAKVYTCFCHKVEKTKAVTHADYRALEEHMASVEFLLKIAREAHEDTLQELAFIKARVVELEVGWKEMTDQARQIQHRHLDNHEGENIEAFTAACMLETAIACQGPVVKVSDLRKAISNSHDACVFTDWLKVVPVDDLTALIAKAQKVTK